jgi:predicted CoA-binding protein
MNQYETLADPEALIAVVGATDTPGKYGGIIYRDLKGRGHRVVAVNPKRERVDGDPCFPDLQSLPEAPDLVNVVTPPWEGRRVLEDAIALEQPSIWFQPGADHPDLSERASAAGLDVVAGPCIMVVSRQVAPAGGRVS